MTSYLSKNIYTKTNKNISELMWVLQKQATHGHARVPKLVAAACRASRKSRNYRLQVDTIWKEVKSGDLLYL